MVQGGLKKVQGGLEPPLAPHFPRLCLVSLTVRWQIRTVARRRTQKDCKHPLALKLKLKNKSRSARLPFILIKQRD